MNPFQAHNIGFGLPCCQYFKVEIISVNGPSRYFKIGADNEPDAISFALRSGRNFLASNGGLSRFRCQECGQFQAVLQ